MELSDHQTGQLHLALLQRLLQPELSWLELSSWPELSFWPELSSWPFPARAAARLGLDLRVQLSFELCQLGLLEHLRNGS
tara:strand:- start:1722 stop:1961 length:240 start_codon:yes stop_codon:yes gene_type:complete